MVKWIGKIEVCSILANFCKTRPRLLENWAKQTPISAIFCTVSPKQARWAPIFYAHFIDSLTISDTWKTYKNLSKETWNIIGNVFTNKNIAFYVPINHDNVSVSLPARKSRIEFKIAMKKWDILKAIYFNIGLLHISNENTAYLFEISRYIKYFETRTKHLLCLWLTIALKRDRTPKLFLHLLDSLIIGTIYWQSLKKIYRADFFSGEWP